MSIILSKKQVSDLLDKLCSDLGFCLPIDEITRLKNTPPSDVDAFTDELFSSEGMDPHGDNSLRRQVKAVVLRHFKAAENIMTMEN